MSNGPAEFGFIGAGKMATALIRGIINADLARPDQILASDPVAEARKKLADQTGVPTTQANVDVARNCRTVVLAVYPHTVPVVLDEIAGHVSPDQLVVSVAAGVSTKLLLERLGPDKRVARVMPNTPCLVGAGAAAYCLAGKATEEDAQRIERLLGAVGRAWRVEERLMDAVTGLSGSGPAYLFVVIEALSDGGVRMGLPRAVATSLAAQTVLGAAKMVLETGLHPGQLKDQVASPGGTTIAGLHELERAGLRAALMNAVEAATQRCRALASQ